MAPVYSSERKNYIPLRSGITHSSARSVVAEYRITRLPLQTGCHALKEEAGKLEYVRKKGKRGDARLGYSGNEAANTNSRAERAGRETRRVKAGRL